MQFIQPLVAAGLLIGAVSFNAQAALTSYTGPGNVGLVYSSVSDVTWTKDANLFKTLYDGDNALINLIASITPNYNDPSWGVQTIDAGDFNSDGSMTWWGANAFINYLNSINYGGSNKWRLPTSNAILAFDGTSGNELGQLFYSELEGKTEGGIPDTNNFNNEQTYLYWSGTEFDAYPGYAWLFWANGGFQSYSIKSWSIYAWAVSPGQVAAVPVPGAIWLFGTGLVGWLGSKRRGHARRAGAVDYQ
jgi:hypothetical protein